METIDMNATALSGRMPAALGGTPAFEESVSLIRPNLPPWEGVRARFERIYRSRMLTNAATVEELEIETASLLGVKNAVALSSCTSGLILTMKSLGITGEVIVPSFTFSATGHAIYWAGAKPVFADCSRRDWNISIQSITEAMSDDTQAILAVHIFGNPAPVHALREFAEERGIHLLFDAAHAFGASVAGIPVGGFGTAEIFSLSPTKLLTGGEGGLLTTGDEALAREIRHLRNYGNRGDYNCFAAGLNARMPEFNAALILEGLPLVGAEIDERGRLARIYREELSGTPGIAFQEIPGQNRHSWKDFTVVIEPGEFGIDRDRLCTLLAAENIQTRKYFYPPLHMQDAYAGLPQRSANLAVTDWLTRRVLTLPLYSHLGEEGVRRIAGAIRRIHEHSAEF